MASKKIIKAVATVTAFSVITRALSFIFKIYLSRAVGAEIMGLYQICLSIFFLFSAISASGLPTVLSRKIAETRAKNPEDRGLSLLCSALAIGIAISVATLLSLVLLRPYLRHIVSDPRAVPLFLIMAPALVSTTIYSIIRGWFWGNKDFTSFSITETAEEVLRILFTLLFVSGVVTGVTGAFGISVAFTISDIVIAIVLVGLFLFKKGKFVKPNKINEIFKPALPLTAMRVFSSLIGTIIAILLPSRLIAGGFSVAEATASFGRIAGMAHPLLFAPNAIISSLAIVLIPEMSENGIKKDYNQLNKQINNAISFGLIISGVFLAFFVSIGTELTQLLYKDAIAGTYLQYASLLMLVMPINMIITSALNSIGMEKEAFFSFILGSVFMVAAIYILPQFIGIYSVIVANALSLITTSSLGFYFLRKRCGLNFAFVKTLGYVISFIIPTVFLTSTVYQLTAHTLKLLPIILCGVSAVTMYFGLAVVFGVVDISLIIKRGKKKAPPKKAGYCKNKILRILEH